MTDEPMPKGFTCTNCQTYHAFGPYVLAHWDLPLVHTCPCGAKHDIREGVATLQSPPIPRGPR